MGMLLIMHRSSYPLPHPGYLHWLRYHVPNPEGCLCWNHHHLRTTRGYVRGQAQRDFCDAGLDWSRNFSRSLIGRAISGAIWTIEFLDKLIKFLAEDAKSEAVTIYGGIKVQLSYAWASPIRAGIIQAYGAVQRHMVICGAAFMPLALACVFLWKNVNVSKVHQTKG